MTHRSWFPYILTGLSLALLAVVVVSYRTAPNEPSGTTEIVAPTSSTYETAVREVVVEYQAGGSVTAAYTALVSLRVPTEYQDAHLALVFAFADLKAGKKEEGEARLAVARTAYPWLAGE